MKFRVRRSAASSPFRVVRKVVVAMIGLSVLAFGVALIVLPGPAILVIPFGLAILATEFRWARKLLDPIRKALRRLRARVRRLPPRNLCSSRVPTLGHVIARMRVAATEKGEADRILKVKAAGALPISGRRSSVGQKTTRRFFRLIFMKLPNSL